MNSNNLKIIERIKHDQIEKWSIPQKTRSLGISWKLYPNQKKFSDNKKNNIRKEKKPF